MEAGGSLDSLVIPLRGAAALETPCIKVCIVDRAANRCTGCGRTLQEIALWSRMTDAERRAVMVRLKARKAEQAS